MKQWRGGVYYFPIKELVCKDELDREEKSP
jgi:hypothetical protein